MANKLVPVKLLVGFKSFNAGEVAGFPADAARDLIARKVAAPYAERGVAKKGGGAEASTSPGVTAPKGKAKGKKTKPKAKPKAKPKTEAEKPAEKPEEEKSPRSRLFG